MWKEWGVIFLVSVIVVIVNAQGGPGFPLLNSHLSFVGIPNGGFAHGQSAVVSSASPFMGSTFSPPSAYTEGVPSFLSSTMRYTGGFPAFSAETSAVGFTPSVGFGFASGPYSHDGLQFGSFARGVALPQTTMSFTDGSGFGLDSSFSRDSYLPMTATTFDSFPSTSFSTFDPSYPSFYSHNYLPMSGPPHTAQHLSPAFSGFPTTADSSFMSRSPHIGNTFGSHSVHGDSRLLSSDTRRDIIDSVRDRTSTIASDTQTLLDSVHDSVADLPLPDATLSSLSSGETLVKPVVDAQVSAIGDVKGAVPTDTLKVQSLDSVPQPDLPAGTEHGHPH